MIELYTWHPQIQSIFLFSGDAIFGPIKWNLNEFPYSFSLFPVPVDEENAAASPPPNQELQLSASVEVRGGAGGREVELQTKVTEDHTKFYNHGEGLGVCLA